MTRHALQAATPVGVLAALADELGVDRHGSEIACPVPCPGDKRFPAGLFPVGESATYGSPAHGRWKCHRCSTGGDALELVRLARPDLDNAEAERWLLAWLENDAPAHRSAPPERPGLSDRDRAWVRRGLDLGRRTERVARAFFADKRMNVDPAWATAEMFVAVGTQRNRPDALLMPWFVEPMGTDRALVGATKRYRTRAGWAKRSLDGSRRRGYFYGEHRDQGRPWVVVCEGETDALAVAWWLRDRPRVDVLGVHGASAALTDGMADRLAGRRVVLLPDGDRPGAEWAQRWAAGLRQTECAGRSVARVGVGLDAVAAGRKRVLVALRAARARLR